MSAKAGINWRKGMLRIWLALSIIWLATLLAFIWNFYSGLTFDSDSGTLTYYEDGDFLVSGRDPFNFCQADHQVSIEATKDQPLFSNIKATELYICWINSAGSGLKDGLPIDATKWLTQVEARVIAADETRNQDLVKELKQGWLMFLSIAFGPPVTLFSIGAILGWVVSGFRSRRQSP